MKNQSATEIGARLKTARKAAGYASRSAFYTKHNISRATYCHHETGTRYPKDGILKQYAELLGVDFNWLKYGAGDPLGSTNNLAAELHSGEFTGKESSKDLTHRQSANFLINKKLLSLILIEVISLHRDVNDKGWNYDKIAEATSVIYENLIKSPLIPNIETGMLAQIVKVAAGTYFSH